MTDYTALEDAIIASITQANSEMNLGLVEVGPLSAATADYESLDGTRVRAPGAYVVIGGTRPVGSHGGYGTHAEQIAVTVVIVTASLTAVSASRRAAFPIINAIVPYVLASPGADWKPEYGGFDFTLWRDGVVIHEARFTVKTLNRQ